MKTYSIDKFFALLLLCTLSTSVYSQWKSCQGVDGFTTNHLLGVDSAILVNGLGGTYSRNMLTPVWEELTIPVSFPEIRTVLDKLLFATAGTNLYFSPDRGHSWGVRYDAGHYIDSFRDVDSTLFILQQDTLKRSDDLGYTFQTVAKLPTNSNLFSCDSLLFYYSGYWLSVLNISLDKGISWQELPPVPIQSQLIKVIIGNGNIYCLLESYNSPQYYIYKLNGLQGSWKSINYNLGNVITDMEILNGTLYAAFEKLYRFRESDSTWIQEIIGQDSSSIVTHISVYKGKLFSATPEELYQYDTDQGWSTFHDGLNSRSFHSINVQGNRIWAVSYYGELFVSTDQGITYQKTGWRDVTDIKFLDDMIFLSSLSGLYVSSDFGTSWIQKTNQSIGAGIKLNQDYLYKYTGSSIQRCSMDDFQWVTIIDEYHWSYDGFEVIGPDVYYASSDFALGPGPPVADTALYHVKRSTDNGNSFQPVFQSSCPILDEPKGYLTSAHSTIYHYGCSSLKSENLGETWSPFTLPADSPWVNLFVNDEARIISQNNLLWLNKYTVDSSWTDITGDLYKNNSYIHLKCIGASGKNILASNNFNGLWYRDDLLTSIGELEQGPLFKVTVFPNPSSKKTNISFSLLQPSTGSITIMDLMGRQCSVNNFQFMNGKNTVELQLDSFKPGVYLVKVGAGNYKGTSKFIVNK